jgi:predicted ribosome quality control (RQC) complex YloA/Tae2 family protein
MNIYAKTKVSEIKENLIETIENKIAKIRKDMDEIDNKIKPLMEEKNRLKDLVDILYKFIDTISNFVK